VVFSEPLAPGSITPTSVRLQRGPSVIQGSVHPLQGSATGVVFVPDAPLAVNADYQLTATSALLDLDGDHLEGNVTVSFRTGSSVLGPVASVTLEPDSADVPVGSHFQLTVTARDSLGNVIAGRPVSWWSCDSSLVNVSAAGLVSALAEGSACVVAEIDGVQGVLTVGVSDALVPVASVTLTPESSMVRVADSITLQADIRDSSGQVVSRRLVQWASTNPSIATVTPTNGNGFGGDFAVVRGVSSGMARIVVAVEGKRDTAVVTVGVMGPIVALVLSPDSVSKVLLDTIRIQAFGRDAAGFLTPVNGSQVTWTSSDPTIANVDFSGQVRAARAGSATITGRFGFHQATARIDVVALTLTSISASGAHTCGVTGDGAAYCWGYGWDGELGTGKLGYGLLPQAVAGGLGFSEVGNTCGLADSGRAYCWGLDVGAPPAGCINGPCNLAPVPVAGLLRFLSIREGGIETCGLTTAHDVYCWRRGDTSSPPILVSGGLSFASISVGFQHACAITMDGAAYCWGGNYYGQLGTGDTVETGDTLQPVVGNLTFTALSAGDDHTCGLTPNGDVYCWGGNHYNGFNLWMPQPLAGFSFTQLSGTGHYTCGLDLSGSIRCWEWAGSQFTQPWTITTTLTFTKVSASDDHDCALTANNVAYCWGYNYAGQLGIGTMGETITVPVKVGGQP